MGVESGYVRGVFRLISERNEYIRSTSSEKEELDLTHMENYKRSLSLVSSIPRSVMTTHK